MLEIPLLDISFKLLLLIYPLMLLMVCFPVCHLKEWFCSCCEPGTVCPMRVQSHVILTLAVCGGAILHLNELGLG